MTSRRPSEVPRQEVVSTDQPNFDEVFSKHLVARDVGLTIEQVEKQLRMGNVLRHLTPDDREILMRRHVQSQTLDEIALALGKARSTMHGRVLVAEQNLRREFGRHWLDPVDPEELMPDGV